MSSKRLILSLSVISVLVILGIFIPIFNRTHAPETSEEELVFPTPPGTVECKKEVGEVQIVMNETAFSPNPVTISICTKVTFINLGKEDHWPASNLHPTHGIYPEFDPMKGIVPGESWSFVFNRPGSWKYHDHLIPYIIGTISVKR